MWGWKAFSLDSLGADPTAKTQLRVSTLESTLAGEAPPFSGELNLRPGPHSDAGRLLTIPLDWGTRSRLPVVFLSELSDLHGRILKRLGGAAGYSARTGVGRGLLVLGEQRI